VLTAAPKNNPVLIGEPASAKRIAEAWRGHRQRHVRNPQKQAAWSPWTSAAIDRRRQVCGEFEDRLKAFLKEIAASEGRISCS